MKLAIFIALFAISLEDRTDVYAGHVDFLNRNPKSLATAKFSANADKVDDIFKLLVDIDSSSTTEGDYGVTKVEENEVAENFFMSGQWKGPDPSTLKTYFKILNSLSKVALKDSKAIEDVIKTFTRVTEIYEKQKRKINLANYSQKPEEDGHRSNQTDDVIHSASRVITYLLKPTNIEKVFDISKKAKDEDELLQQLTSIIIGAEERSGGGYGTSLTLDPVTCIALVTLAAYLVRAVFQIVTALQMNRSWTTSDFPFPFVLSDLPAIMVNIHNMISTSEVTYRRSEREVDDQNEYTADDSLIDLSTELSLFMKLTIDNHQPCIKNFICHNLAGKSVKNFRMPEVFWGIIGLYKGKYEAVKHISKTLSNKDEACQYFSAECENDVMNKKTEEDLCVPCSPETMEGYLQMHDSVKIILRMVAAHSKTWNSFYMTEDEW